MRPKLSYTIWFTQRTGSSFLCRALEGTGVAGVPSEWFDYPTGTDPLNHFGVRTPAELQRRVYELGSTPNGAYGFKYGPYELHFSELIATLRTFIGDEEAGISRAEVWERAFPNGKHIFSTRRNKVRLAVSWWKAIQNNEWHRAKGQSPARKT